MIRGRRCGSTTLRLCRVQKHFAGFDIEMIGWLIQYQQVDRTSQNGSQYHSAFFSPDASYMIAFNTDGKARIFETGEGKLVALLKGNMSETSNASFSPNGALVLAASADGTARIWETATGKLLGVLRGHAGPVGFASFFPDGLHVVTTSSDRTARIWDLVEITGQGVLPELKPFLVHPGALP